MSTNQTKDLNLLHDVLCRIHLLSGRQLSDEGRRYLYELSDAAHNLPLAITGEVKHQAMRERDLAAVERLVMTPPMDAWYAAGK